MTHFECLAFGLLAFPFPTISPNFWNSKTKIFRKWNFFFFSAVIRVEGMTCLSCVNTIESTLIKEDGIEKVKTVQKRLVIQFLHLLLFSSRYLAVQLYSTICNYNLFATLVIYMLLRLLLTHCSYIVSVLLLHFRIVIVIYFLPLLCTFYTCSTFATILTHLLYCSGNLLANAIVIKHFFLKQKCCKTVQFKSNSLRLIIFFHRS